MKPEQLEKKVIARTRGQAWPAKNISFDSGAIGPLQALSARLKAVKPFSQDLTNLLNPVIARGKVGINANRKTNWKLLSTCFIKKRKITSLSLPKRLVSR